MSKGPGVVGRLGVLPAQCGGMWRVAQARSQPPCRHLAATSRLPTCPSASCCCCGLTDPPSNPPSVLCSAAAGTYRVLPFSAAEFLVEVPYLAVQSTVYSVIVYWCA